MIINNAPQNEAILSNVGQIGEFRIRNSAKAFSILSSGLYANKIRAIIRELSCNAVDSHVAAGKKDTPFDVHLPNVLEPWFAIRDYGTGLNHDQVQNIYTTYFESTKTDSNAFIGALGLGSKSPFSYTDNFTVTAIKDGRKGIYSAFINNEGVPSIALMMEEQTDEPSGVEVKFSVNDRYDYHKFTDECQHVYRYFELRPVVSGAQSFTFSNVDYLDRDIVPGIHTRANGDGHSSRAIMGNIAYPIDVPSAEQNLGQLTRLLNCGLDIHFAIGELDFQASREGLSYIPSTIAAIKKKLEALNDALTAKLTAEADAIANLWERKFYLDERKTHTLWVAAVGKYVTNTNFPLMQQNSNRWNGYAGEKNPSLSLKELEKIYNINVRGFTRARYYQSSTSNMRPDVEYDRSGNSTVVINSWSFAVSNGTRFVINDTKIGATDRAKYHYRNLSEPNPPMHGYNVYVLEAIDKTKPMKIKEFFDVLHNPPEAFKSVASSLEKRERVTNTVREKNVTIMKLTKKSARRGGQVATWETSGTADEFDDKTTYYYLPLSAYTVESNYGLLDGRQMYDHLRNSGIPVFTDITIYGVRKGDIDLIKTKKNWINIEEYLVETLPKIDAKMLLGIAANQLESYQYLKYDYRIANKITNPKSPYLEFVNKFKGVKPISYSEASFNYLCKLYGQNNQIVSPAKNNESVKKEAFKIYDRYPLLTELRYCNDAAKIAAYIDLIDKINP